MSLHLKHPACWPSTCTFLGYSKEEEEQEVVVKEEAEREVEEEDGRVEKKDVDE